MMLQTCYTKTRMAFGKPSLVTVNWLITFDIKTDYNFLTKVMSLQRFFCTYKSKYLDFDGVLSKRFVVFFANMVKIEFSNMLAES